MLALASCGSDSEATSGQDAGAQPAQDAAEEAAVEVCNFKDDNGDGRVDEGFRWVLSPAKHVLTTTLFAYGVLTLPLADGSIAAIATDGLGETNDRIAVMRLTRHGDLERGPAMLDTPLSGPRGTGLAQVDDATLGVVSGSEDYAGCVTGCPVTFYRLNATDLALKDQRELDFGFPVSTCKDLACSAAGCVTLATDGSTAAPHLVWFDPDTGSVLQNRTLPGKAGMPALAASDAVAWVTETLPADGVSASFTNVGVWTLDGSEELLASQTVRSAEAGTGLTPAHQNPLRWAGTDLLLYLVATSSTESTMRLSIRNREGEDLADAQVGGSADFDGTVVPVEGNFVAASVRKPFGVDLHRLDADLRPVQAPGNPLEVDTGANYIDLVPTGGGVLLLAADYDGRSIDSREVTCP